MNIGIDATVLDRGMTGTGRYLLNLLKEIPNHDNHNKYLIFTGSILPVNNDFYKYDFFKQSLIPAKIFSIIWLNLILPSKLKKHKIDLLFSPNILTPIVDLGSIKKISVVHDVIPKVYPEYYPYFYKKYLELFLPLSLKNSDKIITVSEFSKKDIVNYYNVPKEKIDVIYNTASDKFNSSPTKSELSSLQIKNLDLPEKYILYVGVIEKRKNIICMLKTIDEIRKHGSKLKLILVGRPGYDFENIKPEIDRRKANVLHYNFLQDNELTYIYKNAFAFIFPSFYEGFGIPPLEAMQSGIPVLTSDSSSLPEVVGDGGILRSSFDFEGFAADILELENNETFYEKMKLKAILQSKKFNIKIITQKLIDIFNSYV
ncbi:MAG: glycosyltransferase family 4 protein [Bacteroidetes bacterium]|nr:glycosyltransferase family 4 protein [Bacteroidota bacterium]